MPEVKGREGADRTDPVGAWVREGAEPGVAPRPLERVRALLNTDDRFHGQDRLAGAPPRLVELRDALRDHLTGAGDGALEVIAVRHPVVLDFGGPDGVPGVRALPGADPLAAATADVLAVVHAASVDGSWDRLKECGNPACRWVFYDSSRNRSGRWCAMGECGDVMKARAYRERRRSG